MWARASDWTFGKPGSHCNKSRIRRGVARLTSVHYDFSPSISTLQSDRLLKSSLSFC
jgi:hypothetical protein